VSRPVISYGDFEMRGCEDCWRNPIQHNTIQRTWLLQSLLDDNEWCISLFYLLFILSLLTVKWRAQQRCCCLCECVSGSGLPLVNADSCDHKRCAHTFSNTHTLSTYLSVPIKVYVHTTWTYHIIKTCPWRVTKVVVLEETTSLYIHHQSTKRALSIY